MTQLEWITVVCLFNSRPSIDRVEELLGVMSNSSWEMSSKEEFEMVYWDATGDIQQEIVSIESAARACLKWDPWMISPDFQECELSLGHDYSQTGSIPLSNFSHLDITVTTHPFSDPEGDPADAEIRQRRERFVDLLSDFLTVADPVSVYGGRSEGRIQVSKDTIEDLLESQTPPLFEYNLFNSDVVENLGRERILSAPAWHVKELETGSVFLITRQVPEICSPRVSECVEVAEHLGLPLAEPDR